MCQLSHKDPTTQQQRIHNTMPPQTQHNSVLCCVVVVLWTEHTIILQHKRSGNFTLPLCCDVICRFRFVKWKFLDFGFQNFFFEKRVNCCRQCHKAQSPFIRFVVDLLYNCLYNRSTENPQHLDMLWICCGLIQQIHNKSTANRNSGVWISTSCGLVVALQPITASSFITWRLCLTYRRHSENGRYWRKC